MISVMSVVGAVLSALFGGFDSALYSLLLFMAIDFVTGWIVAGVFHRSRKTETGALDSGIGFRGICKKCVLLVLVIVGVRLDVLTGLDIFRDGVIFGIVTNELLSILENVGLMGVKYPAILERAIDILTKKETANDDEDKQ